MHGKIAADSIPEAKSHTQNLAPAQIARRNGRRGEPEPRPRGAPPRQRRAFLSGALALAAARLGLAAAEASTARTSRRSKPNQYGCLEVGNACKRASQCCSSICIGKPGKKKCRAHDIGTCKQGTPGACTADNPDLLRCGGNSNCFCFRTTAGSNFCGDWFGGTKICHSCASDADCVALGLPAGAACVPVTNGNCATTNCEGGMMCMAPCGAPAPDPAVQ